MHVKINRWPMEISVTDALSYKMSHQANSGWADTTVVGGDCTMRADIIGLFKPCMTDIYLHIDARMADYIRTHP